jgi:hypothetical protein
VAKGEGNRARRNVTGPPAAANHTAAPATANHTVPPVAKAAGPTGNPVPDDPYAEFNFKVVTRADLVEALPARICLDHARLVRLNEKVLGWLVACTPGRVVGAMRIVIRGSELLLLAGKAGDKGALPLEFSTTGVSATCRAAKVIPKRTIPLLSQGSVRLDVSRRQLGPNLWCVVADLTSARLSRTEDQDARQASPRPARRPRRRSRAR